MSKFSPFDAENIPNSTNHTAQKDFTEKKKLEKGRQHALGAITTLTGNKVIK